MSNPETRAQAKQVSSTEAPLHNPAAEHSSAVLWGGVGTRHRGEVPVLGFVLVLSRFLPFGATSKYNFIFLENIPSLFIAPEKMAYARGTR